MTAFYDFFRFIKLYSTDGTTLEHTIEADAVTDTLSISRGAGVAWTGASAATDSFKIDVNYNLEVPVGTTTLRLTDVHSVDQDIELHAGGNMTITRNHSGSITLAALMGGVSRVITLATQTSPVVITTNTVHDFTEGTPVTIVDVVGMTQLNGNEYYADVITSNTLALYEDDVLSVPLDGTGFTAYTSGGVATGEYAGAKKINDLTDVKFNAPNFADSIMLGYTTTGTLSNAHSNIFIGKDAGKTVTSGNQNTVIGHKAGDSITDGTNNVLIGAFAGDTIQGGDGNVIISAGHSTDPAGGWSNNITSLVTGDGKRRLYIGQENPNVDGTVLDGQYYSNIWHHSTQVGAFRAQGESGGTTVTNPPYATTYLERAYITIDATNNPVIHQPARIHVGGGHLALHGGDGFVVGSTMTEYTPAGQWGASGTRTPGTYTGVTVATGVSGNHPTFTVVVAVSDGSITSVTSETTGSEIFDLTSANTISDSQIGNGGAPDIQFKYEGATTTQAKLTMIGDTNLAVTPAGATINSKDVMLDGAVTSHLIPDTNIAYDLGSATHKFRDLYLDGSSIHLGSTILRDDGAGHLQVNLTNILEIAADDSTIRTINSGESVKFVGAGSVTTSTDAEGNLTITGSTNIVNDTSPQLGGGLSAGGFDIDMGVNVLTDAKVGNWDTAYGWGDHTGPGYLTGTGVLSSHTDVHNAVPSDGQVLTWVGANSRWEPVTDVETDITGSVFADDSTVMVDGVNATLPNIRGTMTGHILPSINAAYDLGNAEYKIRHLFLSTNSLWVGDDHKVEIVGGKQKYRKRKKGIVPAGVQTLLITSVFADTAALLINFKAQIHDPAPSNELDPDHVDFNPPTSKWQEFLVLHGHPNKSVDDIYNTATDFDDEKEETDKATTEGDIVYFDGSGYTRLPLGAEGQVLTANGAGNAPEWSDTAGNPTGAVLSFAGASAPTGWLLCYGQAISRTTYAGLFTVLAEVYGAGDGSTTFNVPDLRGRTIAGQDDMGGASADRLTGAGGVGGIDGDVLGASGGTEAVSLTEAQMPAHDHDYNNPPYTGSTNNVSGIDVTGSAVGSTSQTGTTGSGSAHVNMQPTLILNYIIKT